METTRFEIWCKSKDDTGKDVMILCKIIYQKWNEELLPLKRRAKRIFKKYESKNQKEGRKFYLLQYDE